MGVELNEKRRIEALYVGFDNWAGDSLRSVFPEKQGRRLVPDAKIPPFLLFDVNYGINDKTQYFHLSAGRLARL
jgi:hypothetical protein